MQPHRTLCARSGAVMGMSASCRRIAVLRDRGRSGGLPPTRSSGDTDAAVSVRGPCSPDNSAATMAGNRVVSGNRVSTTDENPLPPRLDLDPRRHETDLLRNHGHDVLNPALPDDDFAAAVRIAQAEIDQHHPDVLVGSSRGGAVAMNIDSGATPLVLLCPAWKRWGTATIVKPGTVILHSRADDVVPFADSEELARNSGLPASVLIAVGSDHRLADRVPLAVMLMACERAAQVRGQAKEGRGFHD